jgi:signal transduction histidine kinase
MMEYIIVAFISGAVTIAATAITAWGAVRKASTEAQHKTELALQKLRHEAQTDLQEVKHQTDSAMQEIRGEVVQLKKSQDQHNGFIERMTRVEARAQSNTHRLNKLEERDGG